MIEARFLDLICCPACRSDLEQTGERLLCQGCGLVYPVADGIPILLPEAAARESDALFTRYWDSEAQAALYDEKVEGGGTIFGVYNHLSEIHGSAVFYEPANMDLVLDAGCGNGRFMETFPAESVAVAVGADASLNLLRRARARGRGAFHVCCVLERLPFKDGAFGTVTSCRVLQHIQRQAEAVGEMGRVTRPGGNVILQVYNTWNPKTLYKAIRQSSLRRPLNAPFKALFNSMSPFDDWGLDYDRYNSWAEVVRWMRRAGLTRLSGRGVGFGFHKYLFQPFYIDAVLAKKAPRLLQAWYDGCFAVEKRIGHWPGLRAGMEKIVVKGTALPAGPPGGPPSQIESDLTDKVVKTLRSRWNVNAFTQRAALAERRRERSRQGVIIGDDRFHLRAALDWLVRAQEATGGGGVSRGYALGWNTHFAARGWQPAYPETTGYIIPTCYDCAAAFPALEESLDLRARALRMADWEIAVQLPSGAVMGGTLPGGAHQAPPSPAIFNTGQVIFGWERAYRETGEQRFLDAALAAGRFLLKNQSVDGAWRRGNSHFADPGATAYNVRVGWALILLGQCAERPEFIEAGRQAARFTLSRQRENGWFRDNCLSDRDRPLLHTICYAMEGILGAAEALDEPAWIEAVRISADALLARISPEGRIPGRFDREWRGAADWDCLTGSAQLAGLLLDLARLTGQPGYRAGADRLIHFLKTTQNCVSPNPGLRGGIKGSFPCDGGYGRYELLNWAAKFFIDALIKRGAGG